MPVKAVGLLASEPTCGEGGCEIIGLPYCFQSAGQKLRIWNPDSRMLLPWSHSIQCRSTGSFVLLPGEVLGLSAPCDAQPSDFQLPSQLSTDSQFPAFNQHRKPSFWGASLPGNVTTYRLGALILLESRERSHEGISLLIQMLTLYC